jgi:hypothetical protein
VEQREVNLLPRQNCHEVAQRGEDGHAGAPTFEIASTEEGGLAHDIERGHARSQLTLHRLCNDETKIMRHAVFEALPPIGSGIAVPELGLDPDFGAADLDRAGRDVIGPEIERAPARKIEARVVPVAGQDAVVHAATLEREAHMRAAVVERVDAIAVADEEDRAVRPAHDEPSFALELLERACILEFDAHDRISLLPFILVIPHAAGLFWILRPAHPITQPLRYSPAGSRQQALLATSIAMAVRILKQSMGIWNGSWLDIRSSRTSCTARGGRMR